MPVVLNVTCHPTPILRILRRVQSSSPFMVGQQRCRLVYGKEGGMASVRRGRCDYCLGNKASLAAARVHVKEHEQEGGCQEQEEWN